MQYKLRIYSGILSIILLIIYLRYLCPNIVYRLIPDINAAYTYQKYKIIFSINSIINNILDSKKDIIPYTVEVLVGDKYHKMDIKDVISHSYFKHQYQYIIEYAVWYFVCLIFIYIVIRFLLLDAIKTDNLDYIVLSIVFLYLFFDLLKEIYIV